MPTRSIPRGQWTEFLDTLTRDHRLQTVSVQVSDPDLGFQIEMRQVPLAGVAADLHSGGGPRIEIMVGKTDMEHTTHSIMNPIVVRLEENEQGEAQVLEVEAPSGSKTLVILRPTAFGEPGELMQAPGR